jgi:hypothetical protein
MDVMEIVHQVRPDIIVLGTGDGDFVPLILRVRRMGVRAEVAAFLPTTAKALRLMCSGFVDIEKYLEEMKGRTAEDSRERRLDDDVEREARSVDGLSPEMTDEPPGTAHLGSIQPPRIP